MPKKNKALPLDIYIPFVQTLFNDGSTLAVGIAAQAGLALLVFVHTHDVIYLAVAVSIALVGALRLASIAKCLKLPSPRTREEALKLENVYTLWGTLHASTLGIFCFAGIFWAHNDFAEIAAVCVTLASVTSIAGRNYGSPKLVFFQIVAATWPISLGLMMRGDVYHVLLGLTSIPFFYAIRRFAETVREVLFSALRAEKNAKRLAQRFDRALNTMSSGLVMLSPEGRVVVANAGAAALLQTSSPERLLGRTLRGLLMRGVAANMLSEKDSRYAEAKLTSALREGKDRKVLLRLANGRHLEFSARESRDELGVITFDDVTARVEAEERIRYMASCDSLTGLTNRASFHETVSDLVASGDRQRLVGLVMFDLDDFKSVNDTLGHTVGDALLYAVAERLNVFATESVKISRFGGDEFMVFFNDAESEQSFTAQMDEIITYLNGDVAVAGHSLRIQASAGAVLCLAAEADVDDMIVRADVALYKAKENGKNNWRLFEAVMNQAFRERQAMKADLRQAVEAKALRVAYQPIVCMESMRIAGCEALCRWDHPESGPVSPAIFIPLAEEMGIISDITTFMLETAARDCKKWPAQIGVSVNLSAKDFRSSEIVDKVRDTLERTGLAPERLEIEVTETALLADKGRTRQYIEQIKSLGVRIALDDFGTGYSSLSYLHTLPLDRLKIDRSFIVDITRDARALELLKGIVNLSRPLGLSVTIEGVETPEQLDILAKQARPELVQGFLFGAAVTGSGIEAMSNINIPRGKSADPADASRA
jgi:diguanylate cyclase (GGDEF)-like protein